MSDPVYTFSVICEAIAAFVGLIFNGYILFVLICSKLTVNNTLLLFMALADSAICLLILMANTSMTLTQDFIEVPNIETNSSVLVAKPVEQWLCASQGALWTVIPLCIVWTICGLIVDRYIAIVRPLSYNRLLSVRKTAILLICIWMCLMSFAIPPLVGCCHYQFLFSHSGCVAVCSRLESNGYEFYYLSAHMSALALAVIIIVVCNAHILVIARKHRHRIVTAIYEITMRAQVTITHQSHSHPHPHPQTSPNYLLKYRGHDALVTSFQLVGSLVFFIVPYYVIYAYKSYSNRLSDSYLSSAATLVLSLTPIVNGYVYGVKSKALRQTFKRLLQRYLYEQQASIEIDRRLSLRSQSSLREGWNSLLVTSSLSSNLMRSQRRYSAPLSLSQIPLSDECSSASMRRQSLDNLRDTRVKSFSRELCAVLSKRPSFLAETKVINKIPLSPIQEMSHSFSDQSSVAINSE